MRNLFITLLALSLTSGVIAQKTQKRFEYASKLYERENYDSALYLFAAIYNKGIGNPALIAKSYYNIGIIYLEKKDTVNARRIFKDIIYSNFDDMDRGGTGSGLMAEPYALYKNNSCKILTMMALQEKDFVNALSYTEMADKDFPYIHFCGNEYAANDIYMASMYARCYEGLGNKERAIETLLPHCIENGLANNSRLVDQLCILLKEKYSKEAIKQQIESAISGMYIKQKKLRDYVDSSYYTKIFNTELELDVYSSDIDYRKTKHLNQIELHRYYFKESEFVKKLLQQ